MPFIAILKPLFKFVRPYSPQQAGKRLRIIRQSVGGLAIRLCAPFKKARDRTQNRLPLLLIARVGISASQLGQGPHSGENAANDKKGRPNMFQGTLDLDG